MLIGVTSIMNILFIENNSNPNLFLKELMPLLFPQSNQIFCTHRDWIEEVEKSKQLGNQKLNLVLYFSKTIARDLKCISTSCNKEGIPVLCIIDEYSLADFQGLVEEKVQGLIQTSETSLKEIKETMELILNGGFFLKAPKK